MTFYQISVQDNLSPKRYTRQYSLEECIRLLKLYLSSAPDVDADDVKSP